jgi:hypothetical protein
MRRRIIFALAVFAVIFTLESTRMTEGDFYFPFCGARALLRGLDPYNPAVCPMVFSANTLPTNPLTAIFFALPFLPFGSYDGPVLFALISALLAFGMLRNGERWKLLSFLSAPFFQAFYWVQWSPLITSLYLIPALLPLAWVKPHIALSVVLTRLNRHRFAALAAVGALSLIVDPTWPLRWWNTSQTYDGFIPLFALPFGPLLALSFLNWRDERARLFFLTALTPQRGYYDLVLLFLLPRSPREMLFLTAASWVVLGRLFAPSLMRVEFWLYVPALVLVLYPTITAKLRDVAAAAALTAWRGTVGKNIANGS